MEEFEEENLDNLLPEKALLVAVMRRAQQDLVCGYPHLEREAIAWFLGTTLWGVEVDDDDRFMSFANLCALLNLDEEKTKRAAMATFKNRKKRRRKW